MAVVGVACTRITALRGTPNPLGKGAFGGLLRGGSGAASCSPTPPAASEKPNLLRDPESPQVFAHRACDVQPTTQCRSTILPREDLLAKKLLPQRGRQGGGESWPRGNFAQRRRDLARCDEF